MRYGRGPMTKYEYACTIAVSLAYLLLRQQDAVGCVAFDDAARMTVPLRTKRNHLDSIIQALELSSPRNKTDLYQILRNVTESSPRRGLMVLVSDLLVDREGLFRGLRLLRSRGHDVMVFHVLDDDELDFPFNGPTRFEGLELSEQLRCNPRALREGYLAGAGRLPGGSPPRLLAAQRRLRLAPHQPAAGRRPGRVLEQPVGNASEERLGIEGSRRI